MPRPRKPARLDWEAERTENGKTRPGTWVVTDGRYRKRTGCGAEDRAGAEEALAAYLTELHSKERKAPKRKAMAEDVMCADVLATYAERKTDASPNPIIRPVKRTDEFLSLIDRLLDFFGEMTLDDVDTTTCHAFIRHRGTHAGARKDLEIFQAAINMAIADGKLREVVKVSLPGKGKAREGWMKREEVAALIRYCRNHQRTWRPPRGPNKGQLIKIDVWPYRHLIPWIMTAVYTASRSGRIWTAAFEETPGRPWIDLETGTYHRMWRNEVETKKRAEDITIPDRLLHYLRRYQRGPLVDGVRQPRSNLVEWKGKAANPRLALIKVLNAVLGPKHGIVLHSFRHTSITWLVMTGKVSLQEIGQYASMTELMIRKVYGHHHPSRDAAVNRAFSTHGAGKNTRLVPPRPRGFAGETPIKERENA
ncbi:hypothetical protein [Aureimonas glaciei]|uniref:Site-specific integrase n=1 Tax=Aureimonas glaciei TaxID=1776957 RepID=A0A916XZX4_9HYPH|nr:hypothetical protein [Aureimonas glaciei]GGD24196.1 hypothetical protein GCM10011335_28910 [Aureimonas glaciei]